MPKRGRVAIAGTVKVTDHEDVLGQRGLVLEFRIARRLDSPNLWRRHHMSGHKLMSWWTQAFEQAIALHRGHLSMAAHALEWPDDVLDPLRPFRGVKLEKLREIPRELRRRVQLIRQVPSARNFLRDDDDLTYTAKPVHDALKNAGIIADDGRAYLETEIPRQVVGLGDWTTVIVLPALEGYTRPAIERVEDPPAADPPAIVTGGRVTVAQLRDLLAGAIAGPRGRRR